MGNLLNKPTIAIDIDDVLSLSSEAFITYSNERWSTELTQGQYDENWSLLWNLDAKREDHRTIVTQRGSEILTNTVPTMERVEGAYEALKALEGHFNFIVVTSRRSDLEAMTLIWLKTRYPNLFHQKKIYFTGFYDTIKEGSWRLSKGDMLRNLGVQYLIDDQVKHCNSAARHGITSLLFGGYAHQRRGDSVHTDVVAVHDWNAVKEFFDAELKRLSSKS